MFRTKKTKSLVFRFSKPTLVSIHSLFVFFKILVIWFDENERVIDFKIVKPFSINIKPSKPFSKIIESPLK